MVLLVTISTHASFYNKSTSNSLLKTRLINYKQTINKAFLYKERVNLSKCLLFIFSRGIKCVRVFSLSLNNDLKLFSSFAYNMLSVNEGISPGYVSSVLSALLLLAAE